MPLTMPLTLPPTQPPSRRQCEPASGPLNAPLVRAGGRRHRGQHGSRLLHLRAARPPGCLRGHRRTGRRPGRPVPCAASSNTCRGRRCATSPSTSPGSTPSGSPPSSSPGSPASTPCRQCRRRRPARLVETTLRARAPSARHDGRARAALGHQPSRPLRPRRGAVARSAGLSTVGWCTSAASSTRRVRQPADSLPRPDDAQSDLTKYARSKLAVMAFGFELARRLDAAGTPGRCRLCLLGRRPPRHGRRYPVAPRSIAVNQPP